MDTINNDIFAERFKALRTDGGYTQQEIANLFNVTRACICYWESGKRVPDYVNLVEICKFFRVSSDYMLGVSDVRRSNIAEDGSEYKTNNILDMSRLTEDHKRELRDYYNYLLKKQSDERKISK